MKALATTKKLKRFEDGGEVSEDVKSFAGTPENDSNAGMADATSETATEAEAAKPEYKSFKEAFAANRKAGAGTFEYNGKKYTTELTGARKEASSSNYGNESRRPTKESSAPTTKKSNILEDAKEGVRRGNAARAAMAEASRPKMTAGSMPKKGPGLSNFKDGGVVARASVKSHGKAC